MRQIVRQSRQLGAIIQSQRRAKGLTQAELADLAGTQQKTISAIENGNEGTKLGTLLGVIAILGLDLQVVPRHTDNTSIEDIF
ncbi:helix-turn-helix domain-containing protein [Erythrobacter sp. EC-HK427]|uniref:helix-turn-helix domain-containing protein n=1 Tax=Erythrobacter sp. EC-HK427 TaxID=2038396 RepID=UPI001253293A|nr:helix-turn-helix domain-containing protein [Erythrobacter sp. EC-HK427]VVT00432.1 XRE family transcriptional regulator [Erythrobacter sp. EC-HK427]